MSGDINRLFGEIRAVWIVHAVGTKESHLLGVIKGRVDQDLGGILKPNTIFVGIKALFHRKRCGNVHGRDFTEHKAHQWSNIQWPCHHPLSICHLHRRNVRREPEAAWYRWALHNKGRRPVSVVWHGRVDFRFH